MNFKWLFFFICFATALSSYPLAYPGFFGPWGKDSDLKRPEEPQEAPSHSIGTRIAEKVILFHQQVISPVDGPRSHFRPSSSQYMKLAMFNYGFFKGFIMGCDRLLRENNEEWVYRKIEVDGKLFKYDPAVMDKYY